MDNNIFLIFLFLFSQVNSQELAPNGDFDNDITNWHCGSVKPIWVADDGSSISGNGSLQHSRENYTASGGQLTGGFCDWAVVLPEQNYQFDGYYKLLTNSSLAGVLIDLYWFSEDEIFISVDSVSIPGNTIARDTWISFTKSAIAPLNATKLSISIDTEFNSNGQTESTFLRWDDLHLIRVLPDSIFSNGFE